MAIGSVDKNLSSGLEYLLGRGLDDRWDPKTDAILQSDGMAKAAYEKYSGEVYGVLCGLTSGEAKSVIKGCVDRGFGQDGFKALVD